MTPKQKAKELTDDIERIFFGHTIGGISPDTKKAALMVADEWIQGLEEVSTIDRVYFWKQVKEEIEKI